MLIVVDYLGRFFLGLLVGSWSVMSRPRARNFNLAVGSLALGLIVAAVLHLLSAHYPSCEIDRLTALVWLPAGTVIFTFVIEGSKKEMQKNGG